VEVRKRGAFWGHCRFFAVERGGQHGQGGKQSQDPRDGADSAARRVGGEKAPGVDWG
jgi:hypothetical protein